MITLTSANAIDLVKRELGARARQRDLAVIENQSGTVQLEVTSDELDDFERAGNPAVDSDMISDELMEALVSYLKREALLE